MLHLIFKIFDLRFLMIKILPIWQVIDPTQGNIVQAVEILMNVLNDIKAREGLRGLQTYVLLRDVEDMFGDFAKCQILRFDRKISIYSTSRTIWCIVCASL